MDTMIVGRFQNATDFRRDYPDVRGWHGAMLRASEFRYADTNSKFT